MQNQAVQPTTGANRSAHKRSNVTGGWLRWLPLSLAASNQRRLMKQNDGYLGQLFSMKFALALVLSGVIPAPVRACTIFVLTDTNRALFCNNEDWSNPKARIWFVPADAKHYGCVYVGFDDDFAQGGLNTKGLASDWVAGFKEAWKPDPSLPTSVGNRQLLETCATVEEAIAFLRGHRELGFYTARILVADRSGASAIMGARDGRL